MSGLAGLQSTRFILNRLCGGGDVPAAAEPKDPKKLLFVYPPGTRTRHVLVTLSERDFRLARQVGGGYASRGLREALRSRAKGEKP